VPRVAKNYNKEKLLNNYFTIGKRCAKRYRNILGERFLVYDVTDVDGRAPTSNRANPYWHGFDCGSWNKDIVLKSGGSDDEPPNGNGRPPPSLSCSGWPTANKWTSYGNRQKYVDGGPMGVE